MKNFRKVLALVLVVATLFSFAAMAGAKSLADYEDADKVSYDTAVEVLSALEILNGYEDDTFKPTNNITRAEMAKMIAVLSNAGDDVSELYAAACDFADAKDNWAASYIAYCAQTGIVAGRSATTFDPYGKVTGLETAKMLLVTMGFEAEAQGYTGSNWKINVLRDAKNFGLLNGFAADYNVDVAITREEAANMMLNALCAPVIVGTISNNIVTITNATYYNKGITTLIDAEKYGLVSMYGNVLVSKNTLAKALYGNRLNLVFDQDCYGRPGSKWTLIAKNGKTILDGQFFADSMLTSANEAIDLDKLLAAEIAAAYDLEVWVDGDCKYDVTMSPKGNLDLVEALLGKGVVVEVYVEDTGYQAAEGWVADGKVTIVIINTYIGEISEVNLSKGTFTIAYSGEASYKNTFGFTKEDKGSIVLYWPCGESDGLHDCQIIEPTVATVQRADKYSDGTYTFVADGKTYSYAKNFWNYMGAGKYYIGENQDAAKDLGDKHDIYTDLFGNVMYFENTITDTLNVAVVKEGTKRADALTWVNSEEVQAHYASFMPFAADTTAVEKVTGSNASNNFNGKFYTDADTLVQYVTDEDGNITAVENALSAQRIVNLNKGSAEVSGMQEYITENTQFIVRVKNYATGVDEYKYFDGLEAINASYVSDGEANSFQYFLDETGRYFTYVYVKATYAVESHRAFVLSLRQNTILMTDGSMVVGGNQYNAIVDGEEAIVIYERDILSDLPVMIKSEWVNIGLTIDGIPVYANANEDLSTKLNYCPFHEIRVEGNVITWVEDCTHTDSDCVISDIEGAQVANDALIMVVYPVSGGYKAVKMTAAEFDAWRSEWGWAQGDAWATVSGGKVTELVVLATKLADKP